MAGIIVGDRVRVLDHPCATHWHRRLVGNIETVIETDIYRWRKEPYDLVTNAPQGIIRSCLQRIDNDRLADLERRVSALEGLRGSPEIGKDGWPL